MNVLSFFLFFTFIFYTLVELSQGEEGSGPISHPFSRFSRQDNRDDVKKILSPVIKFSTMLVRPVATNKRAFYLMNTTQMGAQLYELQVEYIFNKVLYKRILHCVKVYISGQVFPPIWG